MVQRGMMSLDEPVAKYLPASVNMPSRGGKAITLLHLATHTSGLPRLPDNLQPARAENPFAEYAVNDLYAFLSGFELQRDPGAELVYSDTGMGLLGQAIAHTAGTDYESLVIERICRPLGMDSTRITLSPELRPEWQWDTAPQATRSRGSILTRSRPSGHYIPLPTTC
jgi:D-alanyl-D-alanine-carboxypeptidase/D-alanyl-D-alanine-endopeptidase